MQKMAHAIEDVETELMTKLDSFAKGSNSTVDLGDYLHFFGFDVSSFSLSHFQASALNET